MSPVPPAKRYGLFALAILLLLFGGVALFMGAHNHAIRALGSLACVASAYLVKLSNIHARSNGAISAGQEVSSRRSKHPPPLLWALGVISLAVLGIASLFLYKDALGGYHEVQAVYVFAGASVACALVWAFLISKLM